MRVSIAGNAKPRLVSLDPRLCSLVTRKHADVTLLTSFLARSVPDSNLANAALIKASCACTRSTIARASKLGLCKHSRSCHRSRCPDTGGRCICRQWRASGRLERKRDAEDETPVSRCHMGHGRPRFHACPWEAISQQAKVNQDRRHSLCLRLCRPRTVSFRRRGTVGCYHLCLPLHVSYGTKGNFTLDIQARRFHRCGPR